MSTWQHFAAHFCAYKSSGHKNDVLSGNKQQPERSIIFKMCFENLMSAVGWYLRGKVAITLQTPSWIKKNTPNSRRFLKFQEIEYFEVTLVLWICIQFFIHWNYIQTLWTKVTVLCYAIASYIFFTDWIWIQLLPRLKLEIGQSITFCTYWMTYDPS